MFDQDFHLAKRYYDLAYETNSEAYLPVLLSLIKLHVRSIYEAVSGGDAKAITLRNPFGSGPVKEGEEIAPQQEARAKLYRMANHFLRLRFRKGLAELFNPSGQEPQEDVEATAPAQTDRANPGGQIAQAQRALEDNTDPVRWARDAQERERDMARNEQGEDEDYLEMLGGRTQESDLLESVAIIALCLAVGCVLSSIFVR